MQTTKPDPVFIFDYGNVISVVDPSMFLRAALPYCSNGPVDVADGFERARDLLVRYESGRMSSDDFIHDFLDRFHLHMSRPQFVKAWSEFFVPIEETRRLIRALKKRYRVALLSNTNPLHYDYVIRTTDVFPLFDVVTLSYEVGTMKPGLPMYQEVLRRLDVGPSSCVFIDDLRPNLDTATTLGMRGILMTTPEQLERDIRAIVPDLEG